MSDIKTAPLEALRAMKERGELSAPDGDAADIDLPEGFWDEAELRLPKRKQQVNMRVDPDILDFFKAQGKGHLTRMHAVLRAYVDLQKRRAEGE